VVSETGGQESGYDSRLGGEGRRLCPGQTAPVLLDEKGVGVTRYINNRVLNKESRENQLGYAATK